jgi:hypothetical protein
MSGKSNAASWRRERALPDRWRHDDLGPDPAISSTHLIKISNKHAAEDAVFDVIKSARPHLMLARNEGMPHA